jgi:SAM-dependent methyltransferase
VTADAGRRARGRLARLGGVVGSVMLLPRVALLGSHAPRDHHQGFERYWSKVQHTGAGGDVLWDTSDLDETAVYLDLARTHLDTCLPLVDAGCGNGGFTRHLAPLFPSTIGVDFAESAVALARAESGGVPGLTFEAIDLTGAGAGGRVHREIGDANVFVRGVFHILKGGERDAMARNLRQIVGGSGRLLLAETNFPGTLLGYLRHLGASAQYIPPALERAIVDLPAPGHFGLEQRRSTFGDRDWTVVAEGDTEIEAIPLHGQQDAEHIPGYFAVLAPRAAVAGERCSPHGAGSDAGAT